MWSMTSVPQLKSRWPMTSADQWDPAGNRLQKGYFQVIDYFDQNDISAAIRLGERVKSWAEKGVKIYPTLRYIVQIYHFVNRTSINMNKRSENIKPVHIDYAWKTWDPWSTDTRYNNYGNSSISGILQGKRALHKKYDRFPDKWKEESEGVNVCVREISLLEITGFVHYNSSLTSDSNLDLYVSFCVF